MADDKSSNPRGAQATKPTVDAVLKADVEPIVPVKRGSQKRQTQSPSPSTAAQPAKAAASPKSRAKPRSATASPKAKTSKSVSKSKRVSKKAVAKKTVKPSSKRSTKPKSPTTATSEADLNNGSIGVHPNRIWPD